MAEAQSIPITFDEEMLHSMLSGGVVQIWDSRTKSKVKIILSDIGWDRMAEAFAKARTLRGRSDCDREQ